VSSNGGSIPFDVVLAQVNQQSPPTTDELKQTTPGVVILPMQTKMGRETKDALCKEGDLDLWRTCIRVMDTS
jgi:hypothetical protein